PILCQGDLEALRSVANVLVQRGPRDLRDLPDFFSTSPAPRTNYGAHDIAILAEINHAPRLPLAELLAQARALQRDGADLIDVGCDPGSTWAGVGEAVRALREEGVRVSIDRCDEREVAL